MLPLSGAHLRAILATSAFASDPHPHHRAGGTTGDGPAADKAFSVLAGFALGYRIGEWPLPSRRRPFTLGVYAGARCVHLGNDPSGGVGVIGGRQFSGDVSDTINWADPIGLRFSVPVLDSVSLTIRGDIGGFGASSDLDS